MDNFHIIIGSIFVAFSESSTALAYIRKVFSRNILAKSSRFKLIRQIIVFTSIFSIASCGNIARDANNYSNYEASSEYSTSGSPKPPDTGDQNLLTKNLLVKIFYATDRNENKDSLKNNVSNRFLSEWSDLKFGTAFVSIPLDHKIGKLETPEWWRLEFTSDPEKHIVLKEINAYSKDHFIKELSNDVASSSDNEAFVFIHGYNTTFEDAARRTAQISHDLQFKGPAILYSWPSQGEMLSYPQDEVNADRSSSHLEKFLSELSTRTSAKKIHLIAHSMGNRVLVNALSKLITNDNDIVSPSFNQILLAAPDIDVEVFRDIAEKITKAGKRTTIYASDHDKALNLSRQFHGYPRVGDSRNQVFVTKGIDTIDVSAVDTSFFGHGYYGGSKTVISDLYYLMRGIEPSNRYGLIKSESMGETHWIFQP